MKISAAMCMCLLAVAGPAMAQTVAPAASTPQNSRYSIEETDIGTLLDDPAAKAILDKNVPGFSANPQIDMARSMTLKTVQQYSPDTLTDQTLSTIQADLNKLPKK